VAVAAVDASVAWLDASHSASWASRFAFSLAMPAWAFFRLSMEAPWASQVETRLRIWSILA